MARILLADDDDSVRAFVKRALEMDGHFVDECVDGDEALARLNVGRGRYDLLLSDICMPRMDGIELARCATRMFPGLSIVLMTGYADQRENADELGAMVRDVIMKPFSLGQFRMRIGELLSRAA